MLLKELYYIINMDRNHLEIDPWKLTEALEVLGYEVPSEFHYYTEHHDMYLQPFEAIKGGIILNIIPYSFEYVEKARKSNRRINPRLVKTIKPEGIPKKEQSIFLKNLVKEIADLL